MLYIFKSSSAADVVMQRFSAEKILSVIGKTPSKTGVITLSEIAVAISDIESELERQAQIEQGMAHSGAELYNQHDGVQFRQSATVFLDLLRISKAASSPVTWGL